VLASTTATNGSQGGHEEEVYRGWPLDLRRPGFGAARADHDRTGLSSYPYGADAEETSPTIVWWENQEILHHGAEITPLRDLYVHRAQ
jgi:hypothetical protein